MLNSRCLQRSSHYLRKGTPLRPLRPPCRNISTTYIHTTQIPPGSCKQPSEIPQSSWLMRPRLHQRPTHLSHRFASTNTKSIPIAEVQSAYPSRAITDPPVSAEWPSPGSSNVIEKPGTLDDIFNDGPPQINEYIGYLKDMGIDYGWGPTSLVQTLLEHIHIYTGAPWWASIALTVLAIRLSIFKFYINAQDASARQAAIKPISAPIDARYQAAVASGDRQALRAVMLERKALFNQYGVKPFRVLWPILFQVPLGFGTFRLVRGMSALPVPGFDQGGLLWFTDLTVPDPLYIMPVVTAATFFMVAKLGGEAGGSMNNMSPTTYKIFCYVLPCITGFFAMFWPAGIQIPIFLGGIFSGTQNLLFRQVWFRNLCGIQPRGIIRQATQDFGANRGPRVAKAEPKGFVDSIKGAYNDVVEQGKKIAPKQAAKPTAKGRTEADWKKAKAYEEKVARETAQRRFEAKQAKEAREDERRQRGKLR